MQKEQRISVIALILGISSLILCFCAGYAGPFLGAGAAGAAWFLAGRASGPSTAKLNRWGRILGVLGLIVNAVSGLAMLLMLLLGAALLGSPGGFF